MPLRASIRPATRARSDAVPFATYVQTIRFCAICLIVARFELVFDAQIRAMGDRHTRRQPT